MIRTLFLISLIFLFSGCFSLSSLNPFSPSSSVDGVEEIDIPSDAPEWLSEPSDEGYFVAVGVTKNTKSLDSKMVKQKALINAGYNLSRKIYSKVGAFYSEYVEETNDSTVFDNDIKNAAKEVALKARDKSKIDGFWEDDEGKLYTLIRVDYAEVAKEIQITSKKIFKVDKTLYENILSNRAFVKILEKLED